MSDLHNSVIAHVIKSRRQPFEEFELHGEQWYYRKEDESSSKFISGRRSFSTTAYVLLYQYSEIEDKTEYKIFHFVFKRKMNRGEYLPGEEPKQTASGSRNQNNLYYKN